MAHVHCVIIGFDRGEAATPALYTYSSTTATPIRIPAKNISPYLLDGRPVYVEKRTGPLGDVPPVRYGTKPADGGHLILDGQAAYDEAMTDQVAAKYVRRYVGAREIIHNEQRWCLWLEDLDPADLGNSPFLRRRVEACRTWRSRTHDDKGKSLEGGDAYKLRNTPHLMRPNKNRPRVPYLCIPIHFSQDRLYMTAVRLTPDVIASNANFTAIDPDGLLFAMISSSMFMAWQRAAGGRIKSDPRFSNTVVWNNLPLPHMTDATRAAVIAAGTGILAARDLHPERSLADHYNPLAMDPALVSAHTALDRIVDRAF